MAALEADSKRVGTQGGKIDFALLVDGLTAEREQGITIDVAYRFFATSKRKFIVADTPGHEQYTRNMVTGASTADLAVLLVDARKGVLEQTAATATSPNWSASAAWCSPSPRWTWSITTRTRSTRSSPTIAPSPTRSGSPTGSRSRSRAQRRQCRRRAARRWAGTTGRPCSSISKAVPIDSAADRAKPFRMPVQWVNRPDQHFRGFRRPDRQRQRRARRRGPHPAVGPHRPDRPDRHLGRRPRPRPSPASRSR